MEKRIPSREELQNALLARCTREEVEKLRNAESSGGRSSWRPGVLMCLCFLARAGDGTSPPC